MKTTLIAVTLCTLAMPAAANEFEPQLRAYLENSIVGWASDAAIVDAVEAQNQRNAAMDQTQIDALDLTWRGEIGASATPTIDAVLNNASSDFLRRQVEASGGVITEVFTVDMHGLNVAASAVTSDYWQGDEDKYSQTYAKGAGAVHIGDVEFDESTQTYQAQVSLTLVDPATGQPIGAMTVGLNADALF